MSNKLTLIPVAGSISAVDTGQYLFDELLQSSPDFADNAKDELLAFADILRAGGTRSSARQELGLSQQQDTHIFEVLALDLATVFPSLQSGSAGGDLTGTQFCWCTGKAEDTSEENWYRRALKTYFSTGQGGSLLADVRVQAERGRWWLLRPYDKSPATGTAAASATQTNSGAGVFWKDSFDPTPTRTVDPLDFQRRFHQYGEAVFDELKTLAAPAISTCATILWVFLGPGTSRSTTPSEARSSWAASLFAVLYPADPRKRRAEWHEDPQLQLSLAKAVETTFFHLAFKAHETMAERVVFPLYQMSMAQQVAHEFKNLTSDIASLGASLIHEFSAVRDELIVREHARPRRRSRSAAPVGQIYRDLFAAPLARLRQLSTSSRLTSALAFATYWLAGKDRRYSIAFAPESRCEVFEATIHLAIALCKETRPNWDVQGPQLEDVFNALTAVYPASDIGKLVERRDVALLLFAVIEPVRNLRSNNTDSRQPEVFIRTEIAGSSIHILQTTTESRLPETKETSPAVAHINNMIFSAGLAEQFLHIDEAVRVIDVQSVREGAYRVTRRTTFTVFGIPKEASA
jgi:hypothetical protein